MNSSEPMKTIIPAGGLGTRLSTVTAEGQPMDAVRERNLLESYRQSGRAPWKVWS